MDGVNALLLFWVVVIGAGAGALMMTLPRLVSATARWLNATRAWLHLQLLSKATGPVWWVDRQGEIKGRNTVAKTIWHADGAETLGDVLAPFGKVRVRRLRRHLSKLRAETGKAEILGYSGMFVVSYGRDAAILRVARPDRIDQTAIATFDAAGVAVQTDPPFQDLFSGYEEQFQTTLAYMAQMDYLIAPVMTRHGQRVAHIYRVVASNGATQLTLRLVHQAQGATRTYADLDTLGIPLVQIDENGAVLVANSSAVSLLGQDVQPGHVFAGLFESLGRSTDDWVKDALIGRGLRKPEFLKVSGIEQEIFVQVSLIQAAYDADMGENNAALLAICSDATEHKNLETQFVQSQKMQAIGQLAGGVAHDFNNLLTAISGHCDLLLLRHNASDIDYNDLTQINQNANRAAALVEQLLAFSRKQTFKLEVVDVEDILTDMAHLLNRLVGERVRLRREQGARFPRIRVDKRQMEQVLMNLVVNARDAMPEGGEIVLSTSTRVLSEPLHRDQASVPVGEYLELAVKDTGCGMSADLSRKIFEPFFSTKKAGEGTGLGLSTAYGIVKQSGGFIFVDSCPGEGTVFTVLIPAFLGKDAPVVHKAEAQPETHHDKTGVVLLVEDEAPVRAFAKRALELRGMSVLAADSAEAALEILSDPNLHIDVFISDVVMPGLDGPSWVSQARQERPDVPVIFMSGYAKDITARHRDDIPNSAFLQKPFSLEQLVREAQSALPVHPVP